MRLRSFASLAAATALLLTLAGVAAAGGWADVRPDPTTKADPPVEGQPTVIGFTVLQHGVTPAGWVTATVRLTDLATGETMDVAAGPGDDQGHFAVTVTLPRAGLWTWTVAFDDLAHDARAFPMTVRLADGSMPTVDPAVALTAVDRARADVTEQVNASLYAEVGRIDGALSLGEIVDGRQAGEIADLTARLAAVEAAGAGSAAEPSAPLPVVVLLAILAGATAGFAMAWLAGRPGPRSVEVSSVASTPRGSTTA